MLCLSYFFVSVYFFLSSAILPSNAATPTVQLVVSPVCGSLSGSPSDINAGLGDLSLYKNIIAFGDSYTDGGVHNGSALKPAVLVPPNPEAGGRVSNGPVWVEYLASDIGATLKDYAANGAVVDATEWPSAGFSTAIDFVDQINLFTTQYNNLDPDTTLYAIFYGIGDNSFSGVNALTESSNQARLVQIADDVIYNMLVLSSSPTFARNFLVVDNYGRGTTTTAGEAWKQELFTGLGSLRNYGLNVGFVDLKTIWDGVLGETPGYEAFGYTNPGACTLNNITTVGQCADPAHSFYWIPGNPSTATHRIMANFVEEALANCQTT